jgi:hypothetical protein
MLVSIAYRAFRLVGGRKSWLCLFWLSCISLSPAQSLEPYQPLQARGPIPEDFLTSTWDRYENALARQEEQSGAQPQPGERAFLEKSSYFVNKLMGSGKILFNDPVSQYFNAIADSLLRAHPALRSKLRFYAVKSPSPNAFATHDGIILINLGLLARLESEAQLAFIISHEIAHFVKQHPLEIYLNKQQARNRKESLEEPAPEQAMLTRNNYSQQKELEADDWGLQLYLQSDYDRTAVTKVFNVLKSAARPIFDLPFDPHFFDTEVLKVPPRFFADSEQLAQAPPTESYESGSHPSPDLRRDRMALKTENLGEGIRPGKQNSRRFTHLREVARFESTFLLLFNRQYEAAIYQSYALLQQYPGHFYLQKIIAQSLYGLSRYADEGRFWDVHRDFDLVSGQARGVNYLFEKLEEHELNLLSLAYVWALQQAFPKDEELRLMVEDLTRSLAQNYLDRSSGGAIAGSEVLPGERSAFTRESLNALLEQEGFRRLLARQTRALSGENGSPASPRRDRKKQRTLALKGVNLGLDSLVFVDPEYQRFDFRQGAGLQYLESEGRRLELLEQLGAYAQAVELEVGFISRESLEASDMATFRDWVQLNQWVEEKTSHEGLQLVSIHHAEVQHLVKKYGTPHFAWTRVQTRVERKSQRLLTVITGIIILPYALYKALSPRHDTHLYTMVYDLRSGKYLTLLPKHMKVKDRKDFMESALYDLLWQLKQPGKD